MANFPQIPGYRIEKELGRGGMARVYLAHEEKLDRHVALKVLLPSLAEVPQAAERFLKEARTAAKLHHSGIITVHDVGRHGDVYYMAVEYLSGSSLKERLAAGPLPPGEALTIVRQVASTLDYAHGSGYVHRDIKPENILFRADGMAVLTDFGIAKAVDEATRLTKTGISVGTPYYMSPEQARGRQVDGRSDFYSLGIVLHEMLTGKVPYEAEDSVATAIMHIQEPIPVLPAGLDQYQALLERMLAKNPADRVQCGADLALLIRKLTGPEPLPEKESNPPAKNRMLILALAGMLAVLVAALVMIVSKSEKPGGGSADSPKSRTAETSTVHALDQQSVVSEMVLVPAGSFMMGSHNGDNDEKPVHRVRIDSFYMGKYEVTQGQWRTVMGENPSHFKSGDDYPVENVSLDRVEEFIGRLNKKTGERYRLPTEAEWEYACRAGTGGDRYGDLDAVAWHLGNSRSTTRPAGQKQPNSFGLYDMLGNVSEWCQDYYSSDYYQRSPAKNPPGDLTGSVCVYPSEQISGAIRVCRGGSWSSDSVQVRAANRESGCSRVFRTNTQGFRLAKDR